MSAWIANCEQANCEMFQRWEGGKATGANSLSSKRRRKVTQKAAKIKLLPQ
jgi:hypothetical protein